MGQQTEQPWRGLVWNFRWELDEYGNKRLMLVFAQFGTEWYLNNWNWFDF